MQFFTRTILLSFAVLWCSTSFAQVDLCQYAQEIQCGSVINGSNVNTPSRVDETELRGCSIISNYSYEGGDVIYEVNVSGGDLQVILSGITQNLDLFVLKDCPNARCVEKSASPGRNSELITIPNAQGRYFIVVDAPDSRYQSSFRLAVNCTGGDGGNPGGQCNNNACAGAQYIQCGTTFNGTTRTGSNNFTTNCHYDYCYSGNSTFNGNDKVYAFDVPVGKKSLEIILSNLSDDLDLFLFKDGCSLGNCVAKSLSSGNSNESIKLDNPYGRYFLVIDGYDESKKSDFKLSLDCEDDFNFNCSNAYPLECGKTYTSTTRFNSANLFGASDYQQCLYSNNAYSYAGNDRVFKVNATIGSRVKINMTNLSKDLDLFLFRNCSNYFGAFSGCEAISTSNGILNEQIVIEQATQETYYLIVDGYRAGENSNFKLSIDCESCDDVVDEDCDDIYWRYVENTEGLTYRFVIDSDVASHTGNWEIRGPGVIANRSGTSAITYTFSRSGTYTICYTYYDRNGCAIKCCKKFCIDLSGDCNEIDADERGNNFVFELPNIESSNVVEWRDANTGELLGSRTNLIRFAKPAPSECRTIQATYWDAYSKCYRVCTKELCASCDKYFDNCEQVDFDFTGDANKLTYDFKAPTGLNRGYWTWTRSDGDFRILGGSSAITYTFSQAGTYEVCYNYTDNEGCDVKCCKTICVENPNNCDLITSNVIGDKVRLTIEGTNFNNPIEWTDANSDAIIASNTEQIEISKPASGDCRTIEAKFYDTNSGCYRICAIEVCGDDACCPSDVNNLTWIQPLLTELNECCTNGDKIIQRGTLNGDCFYLVPDCATADGFLTFYDCEGNVLCQEGGIAGNSCESIRNNLTNLTTIWTCESECLGEPLEGVFCTEQYEPVCGCDGVTYSNDCFALVAGVRSWTEGVCNANGADLSLEISANVDQFKVFNNITYFITLKNDGPQATQNIAVQFTYPDALAFTSSDVTVGNFKLFEKVWEIEQLASGESARLELVLFPLSAEQAITVFGEVVRSDVNDPDSTPANAIGTEVNEDDEAILTLEPTSNRALGNVTSSAIRLNTVPNPFKESTIIQFELSEAMQATLSVMNVDGKTIFEQSVYYHKGLNQVEFNAAAQLPSGLYFYRLTTTTDVVTKSMLLER